MVRHFVITIPTPAASLDLDAEGVIADKRDLTISFGTFLFQAGKANTADAFVGAKKDGPVDSSDYGFRLDPGDTAPPIVVRRGQGAALRLGDFAVNGTAGEKVHVLGVED